MRPLLINPPPHPTLPSESKSPNPQPVSHVILLHVQKLEEAELELIAPYEDCTCFAEAIWEVPRVYQPSNQLRALPAAMIFSPGASSNGKNLG
ncbi:hypothetical protein ABZP36_014448 [Zizania latifolia]